MRKNKSNLRVDASVKGSFIKGKYLAVSQFIKFDDDDPKNKKIAYTKYGYKIQWDNIKRDFKRLKLPSFAWGMAYNLAIVTLIVLFHNKASVYHLAVTGALAFDNAGSTNDHDATSGSDTTLTLSFTMSSSANGLLTSNATLRDDSVTHLSVSGVTYAGTSMNSITSNTGTSAKAYLFGLIAPATGANNLVMTYHDTTAGDDAYQVFGAVSFTGADQATGWHNAANASGTSTTPSVTITSAAGEIVVDGMGNVSATQNGSTAGQTQRWQDSASIGDLGVNFRWNGGQQTAAGSASVVMSWTITSNPWAICGVSIIAGSTTAVKSQGIKGYSWAI